MTHFHLVQGISRKLAQRIYERMNPGPERA